MGFLKKKAIVFYQELEIVIGDEHISFTTSKIGSLVDVNQSKWVTFSLLFLYGSHHNKLN